MQMTTFAGVLSTVVFSDTAFLDMKLFVLMFAGEAKTKQTVNRNAEPSSKARLQKMSTGKQRVGLLVARHGVGQERLEGLLDLLYRLLLLLGTFFFLALALVVAVDVRCHL